MPYPFLVLRAFLVLALGIHLAAQTADQPPERAELSAANAIQEVPDRLKELKRIKAAYPKSGLAFQIDSALLSAASQNAATLDELLAAQKEAIGSSQDKDRFLLYAAAANFVSGHANASEFPTPDILKAVQGYRDEAMPLLEKAGHFSEANKDTLGTYKDAFLVATAKAEYLNGEGKAGLATILRHGKAGRNWVFWAVLGEIYADQKQDVEALNAYFQAAAEGNKLGLANAKAVYAKLNGGEEGFEAELEKHREMRPFDPPQAADQKNWQGKAVLVEVFTGSECPPCVAAGYGFDALKESYPAKYLAVLKYHLPIPRYDPMMNPATQKRQEYYNVRSTPSAFVDGVKPVMAGGYRTASYDAYLKAKNAIDPLLSAPAEITIKASFVIVGDEAIVDCIFSKEMEGADYNVAIVQTEEEFKGYNGIAHHKMVVRGFQTIPAAENATATFNIPELEKAAGAYISEWGETAPQRRVQGSQWPLQKNNIDRNKLKAIVFVQDKDTKQVYNAYVADVEAPGK